MTGNKTVAELSHESIKRAIQRGEKIFTLENCPVAKKFRKSEIQVKRWKEILKDYTEINKGTQNVAFQYINDEIGCGIVVVNRSVRNGVFIPKVKGRFTRLTTKAKALIDISVVQKGTIKRPRYYDMTGPLSLVNHACIDHANCATYDRENRRRNDWKNLLATDDIPVKNQLLVNYSETGCVYNCKVCEQESQQKKRKNSN